MTVSPSLQPLKGYQKKIVRRILKSEAVALHVGMGLGKTRAVLEAIMELIETGEVTCVLVVGPIPVIESTWPDEIEKWGFPLSYQAIRGKPAERVLQMKEDVDIFAVNYDMLNWLSHRKFKKWFRQFDMLVIDELTKVKSTKTAAFRLFKARREWFKKRVGMTGTIVPESYVNLYGQMTVLTQLWATKERFLDRYFRDRSEDSRYHRWELKGPKARRLLEDTVEPHILTLDSKDYLEVPKWSVQDYWFDLSPRVRKYYDKFERDMFLQFTDEEILYSDAEEDEVVVDTAPAMKIKLRQIVSGFLYNEEKNTLVFDDTKLKFALRIFEELDENVLMLYQLVEEKRQLLETFGAMHLKGKNAVRRWNSGTVECAVGHPQSMGHGLNLQDGGRILIWYSMPRSHEQYAQSIARLVRTGQTKNVIIIRILARNTLDEVIINQMEDKQDGQAQFTDALKAYRDRRTRRIGKIDTDQSTLPRGNSRRRSTKRR